MRNLWFSLPPKVRGQLDQPINPWNYLKWMARHPLIWGLVRTPLCPPLPKIFRWFDHPSPKRKGVIQPLLKGFEGTPHLLCGLHPSRAWQPTHLRGSLVTLKHTSLSASTSTAPSLLPFSYVCVCVCVYSST